MRLIETTPNPQGNIDRLFLLRGDAVSAPALGIEGAGRIPDRTGQRSLRIFHFNDLHNHLTELSGAEIGTRRFSQMVKRVREAKATGDAVLFLSIGDDHTGTMLDELIGWTQDDFTCDASYRAYSAAGVDATVLGNHEFDRGSGLLVRGIREDAQFPILSANVHSSQHLVPGQDFTPGAIAVVGGIRVGLVGLTTHVETRVGQATDPTLKVASPLKTLEHLLPALAPLVDVVLILSHCGYGDGAHKSGKAAAARDIGEADFSLARCAGEMTDKPVLVLGAHTHTRLNEHGLDPDNILNGVSIFQAECNGQFLGEIEVDLNAVGTKVAKACLHKIKPRGENIGPNHKNAEDFEQDSDVDLEFETQVVAPILAKVETTLKVEIAEIRTNNLTFKSAVLARYAHECALGNFICDGITARLRGLGFEVDLALMNGATLQAGIEPGALTAGNWFTVMPYADEVFIVTMTGVDLEQMLHSNAQRLLRPDEVTQVDHTGFLARGFLHTSREIRYQIDPGVSAHTARAGDITLNGQSLQAFHTREFKVIMSTYLALGGFGERWNGLPISGGVPGDISGFDVTGFGRVNTGLVFRDEVGAYMRDLQILTGLTAPDCDGRLKIIDGGKP